MKNIPGNLKAILVIALVIGLWGALNVGYKSLFQNEIIATVSSLSQTDNHKRVFVDDDHGYGMVFNDDSLFLLKWDSGTVHGKLIPGHKYRMTVVGVRFEFFSMAPNILSVTKIQ